MNVTDDLVSVRYMVNDVQESIDFYTRHFGFEPRTNAVPALPGRGDARHQARRRAVLRPAQGAPHAGQSQRPAGALPADLHARRL